MKKNYQVAGVLSVCAVFLFYKYIAQLFPGLMNQTLIERFQLSGIQIGILASSYYYSYSFMQIFTGIILDKYSIRNAACFAILMVSAGIIAFANTNHYFLMCMSRVLMGVGCAFATTLYLKCAAACTSDRAFGFVSSLLATATMLGAAVGAAPVMVLFEKTGWHHGLILIASLGCLLAMLSLMLIKANGQSSRCNNLGKQEVKQVVFNASNIKLLLYSGITFTPVIIMGGLWGVPFLTLKFHITTSTAASLISMMFIGHAVGSPIWALIQARINNRKKLMLSANVTAFFCMMIILFVPVGFTAALILFFSFGFAVGCFMLCFEICREINGIAMMGIAVAFINSGEGLVAIVLEPGIGFILDLVKTSGMTEYSLADYQSALSLLPLCYVISSVLVYALPQRKVNIAYQTEFSAIPAQGGLL